MQQYQFNLVLLPVEQPIVQILKQNVDWRVIQDDGKHILMTRRNAKTSAQVPAEKRSRD
jgi:hypothetical protein